MFSRACDVNPIPKEINELNCNIGKSFHYKSCSTDSTKPTQMLYLLEKPKVHSLERFRTLFFFVTKPSSWKNNHACLFNSRNELEKFGL